MNTIGTQLSDLINSNTLIIGTDPMMAVGGIANRRHHRGKREESPVELQMALGDYIH